MVNRAKVISAGKCTSYNKVIWKLLPMMKLPDSAFLEVGNILGKTDSNSRKTLPQPYENLEPKARKISYSEFNLFITCHLRPVNGKLIASFAKSKFGTKTRRHAIIRFNKGDRIRLNKG